MTILAYEMQCLDRAPFNFYRDAPNDILCPSCGKVVDRDYAPADLGKIAYRFDVTYTYDGHTLVSQRFRDFLTELCPGSVDFVRVNSAPPIYELRPAVTWSADLEEYQPSFKGRCDTCGLHLQAGQPPLTDLRELTEPVQEGIYGVDTSFVDRKDRTPPIIVGLKTKEQIERHRFQRVWFFPIDDEVSPGRISDPDIRSHWGPDWDDIMLSPDYEPLPDDIPSPSLDELSAFLDRPTVFRCSACLPIEGAADRSIDIAVEHSLAPGIAPDRIPHGWPSSLQRFLAWHNGMTLFQGPADESGFESGFQLYSAADVIAELKHMQQTLRDAGEQSVESWEHPKAQLWLDGLIPIGASLMSADYVVIDTLRRRPDGECPVLLLDHEAYFVGAGSPANSVELAGNVLSFLAWLLQDPVDLLVGDWRYHDADGQQWYPATALFDNQTR